MGEECKGGRLDKPAKRVPVEIAPEELEAQKQARASSVLELTAFSLHTEHGYAIVEGMVKNISSAPIENVQAVAIFTDKSGNFTDSLSHPSAICCVPDRHSGYCSPDTRVCLHR